MRNRPIVTLALFLTRPWAATASAAAPAVAVHMNVWSNKGAVTLIDLDENGTPAVLRFGVLDRQLAEAVASVSTRRGGCRHGQHVDEHAIRGAAASAGR